MIGQTDAERIGMLAEDAEADGGLARKEGHRAVGDTYNLILAISGLMAAALAGAAPQARTDLARRAGATLADAQTQVAAFAAAQQPDLRQALQELAAQGRRLEHAGPAVLAAAPQPVPEDVDGQARDMILQGEAPPAHWRPAIRWLDFDSTKLKDFSLLAELTALERIDAYSTEVTDLAPLAGLLGLRIVWLHYTPVSDPSPLAGLAGLQTLQLGHTRIGDITSLAGLTGLQYLYLNGTQVSDLSGLAGLTGLQSLDLSGTQVSDLSVLAGLTGLQSLNLRGTQVSDLSMLAGLTGLQSLDLRGTQVSDVSALAGLTGLRRLYLDEGPSIDVSPLANLRNLEITRSPRPKASDASEEQG
jgi:hypothetical protein